MSFVDEDERGCEICGYGPVTVMGTIEGRPMYACRDHLDDVGDLLDQYMDDLMSHHEDEESR